MVTDKTLSEKSEESFPKLQETMKIIKFLIITESFQLYNNTAPLFIIKKLFFIEKSL